MIPPTEPFVLPLARDKLASALHKGLGRAFLHAQNCGLAGSEDLLIQACIRSRAFDAQCESDRSPWLLGIIDAAGIGDAVVAPILDGFRQIHGDNWFWDTLQLCRLAQAFAARGHTAARTALYNALRKHDHSMDVLAAEEIIALDGGDGLLHVAEVMGGWLESDPGLALDDSPIRWYDEQHGEGAAIRLLEAAALTNQRIRAFLRRLAEPLPEEGDIRSRGTVRIDQWRPAEQQTRPDPADRWAGISADEVIHEIASSDPGKDRYWYMQWGRYASYDERDRVAKAMFNETNPGRLAKYLRVFQHHPASQFDRRLLGFLDITEGDVPWLITRVLANYRHPDVRAAALALIENGRTNNGVLKLLGPNYEHGDHAFIQKAVNPPSDREGLHSLAWDILDIFKLNKIPEAQSLLLFVYENTPCSNCRHTSVQLLLDVHQTPDWLIEECRHDAHEGTLEAVNQL